ncbi:MAG: DNA replication and repair protein RecF [Syntrophomonadaceae bacterium]|nr:DNA replication and repair protein RecF [Bacillota bacterium]
MKIIKLQAENIKRLKAVEITPKGDMVIISGKNGHGKSSVLDSIWFALGGKEATRDTVRPIRDGEKTATATVDLGDLIVSRNWTSNETSHLRVETKEGARYPSPQKMLDDLVGRLSFDPLEFSGMDSKEQLKTLLSMVQMEINPDEIEAQKQELYDERTVVNREIKSLQGQLDGMSKPETGLPEKELSSADVMMEYQAATKLLAENNAIRAKQDDIKRHDARLTAKVKAMRAQIAQLQEELQRTADELVELRRQDIEIATKVKDLRDPDLDSFKGKLLQVEQINEKIRQAKKYKDTEKALQTKKTESQSLSGMIADLDIQKQEAVKKAKFPLVGLGFSEDGVTYNDIPFKQCSSAEQLRVSLAMAMAINPTLKVILIRDGSLLDSDNLTLISEMAKDKDYQVWIERVSDDGGVGIVIEEGQIKN